jgi:beta-N-acetylhexosaminidase
MIVPQKQVILGISGNLLTKQEYILFKKNLPLGYIIFSRNIKSLLQLKNLITQLKSINPHRKTLIMIDHEGGRVNRFSKFFNQAKFTAQKFGENYKKNKKVFFKDMENFIHFNSNLFHFLGVNLVAAPVLDLFYKGKSKVIGERAYLDNPKDVKAIADIVIKKYKKKNIMTIGKHVPGHGLSDKDTHFFLPKITKDKKFLLENDFAAFEEVKSDFLMTAHIVYEAYDKLNPATLSKIVINDLIRKDLNYKGLIMSDDICMKALSGSVNNLTKKCLNAGCDIILHCNGNLNEMTRLLKLLPPAPNNLLAKIIKLFNCTE